MTSTKLIHKFDLSKSKSDLPIVEVQMNVEYHPQSNVVKVVALILFCHLTKTSLDMTTLMHMDFFKGIIANEIAITNWRELHTAQLYHQHNANERLKDNVMHGIGTGNTFTYLESKPVIGSL